MSRKSRNRNSRMTVSAKERLKSDRNRWSDHHNENTSYSVISTNGDAAGNVTISTRVVNATMVDVMASYKASTNTPNYRALVKSGGNLPTTSLLRQSFSRSPAVVSLVQHQNRPDGSFDTDVITGTVNDSFLLFTAYYQAIESEAVVACNSKLVDKIAGQAFSTGVFLGELNETVRTVQQSAQGLARSFVALRRGDVRTAAKVLTDLSGNKYDFSSGAAYHRYQKERGGYSKKFTGQDGESLFLEMMENLWLTWRYGYRLIMKDVEDAISAYEKLVVDPQTNAALGRSKDNLRVVKTVRLNRTRVLSQQSSVENKILNGELSEKIAVSVTCGANYKVVSPSVRTANQLGLANLAEVAWNLAPWTFVVDWFIPVGSWLSQQGFEAGLEFVRGWRTVRSEHSIAGSTDRPPEGASWSGSLVYPENKGRSFHRQPYTPAAASLAISSGIPDSTGKAIARALDAISLLDGVRRNRGAPPPQGRKPGGFDYFDD